MIYTPVSPLLKYEIKNMEYNIPAVFQGRFDTRMPNLLQNGKSENEKNNNSNNDSDKVLGTIGALCLGALVIGGIMMKKRLPEHHIALSMDKPKSFMVNAYDSKDCAERVIREMEAKRAYAVEQINAAFKSTSESAKQTAKKAKNPLRCNFLSCNVAKISCLSVQQRANLRPISRSTLKNALHTQTQNPKRKRTSREEALIHTPKNRISSLFRTNF